MHICKYAKVNTCKFANIIIYKINPAAALNPPSRRPAKKCTLQNSATNYRRAPFLCGARL